MGRRAARVEAALRRHVARAVTRAGADILAELQESTPVDTGWARANWRATASPPVGQSFPRGSLRLTAVAPAPQPRDELGRFLATPRPKVHVWNPVPYIRRLNRGWSRQAPPGFVEAAVQRGLRLARARLGRAT